MKWLVRTKEFITDFKLSGTIRRRLVNKFFQDIHTIHIEHTGDTSLKTQIALKNCFSSLKHLTDLGFNELDSSLPDEDCTPFLSQLGLGLSMSSANPPAVTNLLLSSNSDQLLEVYWFSYTYLSRLMAHCFFKFFNLAINTLRCRMVVFHRQRAARL